MPCDFPGCHEPIRKGDRVMVKAISADRPEDGVIGEKVFYHAWHFEAVTG